MSRSGSRPDSGAEEKLVGNLSLGSLDSFSLRDNDGCYLDPSDRPAPREAFVTLASFRPAAMGSVAETANAHMRKIKELTDMRLTLSRSADLKTIELTRLQHQLSSVKTEYKSLRTQLKTLRETAGVALAASTSNEVSALVERVALPRAFSDMISREEAAFDPLSESLQEELGDEYDQHYRHVVQASQREIISLRVKVNELEVKIAEACDRIISLTGKSDEVKKKFARFEQESMVVPARPHPLLPALQLKKSASITDAERDALGLSREVNLRRPAAPSSSLPQGVFTGRAAMFPSVENRGRGRGRGRERREENSVQTLERSLNPVAEL